MKILIVCTGNICRSPMGESVLRSRLDDAGIAADVVSAGVSSEETGNPMDRRAAAVLREHDYDVLPGHQAHRATADELRSADLVLAMTSGHERALRRMMEDAGADAEKLHLWGEFDGSGDLDVPDPWYGGKDGFYDTLATVERGADGIVEWLRSRS